MQAQFTFCKDYTQLNMQTLGMPLGMNLISSIQYSDSSHLQINDSCGQFKAVSSRQSLTPVNKLSMQVRFSLVSDAEFPLYF